MERTLPTSIAFSVQLHVPHSEDASSNNSRERRKERSLLQLKLFWASQSFGPHFFNY